MNPIVNYADLHLIFSVAKATFKKWHKQFGEQKDLRMAGLCYELQNYLTSGPDEFYQVLPAEEPFDDAELVEDIEPEFNPHWHDMQDYLKELYEQVSEDK